MIIILLVNIKRITITWLTIPLLIYLGFIAYLWAFQESMIFFPQETTDERWTAIIETLGGEYVSIRADDGAVLEGIFLSNKSNPDDVTPRPTIIFFGGNAMIVEHIIYLFDRFPKQNVNALLVDYRGYGLSTGEPDVEWFKKDAEKIFDAASSHPMVDGSCITVWGVSIGAGIATHLASVKPVEKLILQSPFTSTVDVAFKMFPIVPKSVIRLLLRHQFDNLALAPTITQPALIIHGEADWQAPVEHGRRVAEAWGGPVEFLPVAGKGHNDLWGSREVWERVMGFVKESP